MKKSVLNELKRIFFPNAKTFWTAMASNIQIADLNALNATMAVIKWKKYLQYYQDLEREFSAFYSTNVNEMYNDDH